MLGVGSQLANGGENTVRLRVVSWENRVGRVGAGFNPTRLCLSLDPRVLTIKTWTLPAKHSCQLHTIAVERSGADGRRNRVARVSRFFVAANHGRYLMSTAKYRFYPCFWTVLCILRVATRSFQTFPSLFFDLNIGLRLFSLFSSSLIHLSLSPLTPLAPTILQSPATARSMAARLAAVAVCPSYTLFVLFFFYLPRLGSFISPLLSSSTLFFFFFFLFPSVQCFRPFSFPFLFYFSNGMFCFIVLF